MTKAGKGRTPATPVGSINARQAAHQLLRDILERHQPLDAAIERADRRLDGRDRAFARLLAMTVLRRRGQIDAAINACLDKPLTPKARGALNILRLGAAQLVFLGTPAHAAVGETVDLATGPLTAYAGLINAVLRRLARDGQGILSNQDAARLNTPDWLWASWVGAYGEATARAMAHVHSLEPPLDLSVKADPEAWAGRLEAEVLPTGSLRRATGGVVSALPGFDDGAWWVQDAAAALPVRLLGQVGGETVVDLCAAPGGKAAQLAAAGARVIAIDRSGPRLELLRENLRRLHLSAEVHAADAAEWRPPAPVRFVLLDAPCSSTGTIRRHPDVAYLKSDADIARLMPVQDRLLDAASEMLAVGGVLVYCVCSLQAEEGPERIAAFLARQPQFARQPIAPSDVAGLADLVSGNDLRTLPCHLAERGGMDGFYAARLIRQR